MPLLLPSAPAGACSWKARARVVFEPLPVGAGGPSAGRIGVFEVRSVFRLRSGSRWVHGLSGLLLQGRRMLAISDRGMLWDTGLSGVGMPARGGVARWRRCYLRIRGSAPDAESLARLDDRHIVVAAEGAHRLYRLDPDRDGPPRPVPLPLPDWLEGEDVNAGIEAVTDLEGGGLLLFSEGHRVAPGELRAAWYDGRDFRPLRYPTRDGFVPVGADRVDDVIYVLERRFSVFEGFAARILQLDWHSDPAPDALLHPVELARLGARMPTDNFEGIAARRIGPRRHEIYLVSDDNFSILQQTLLMRLQRRLDAGAAGD